MFLDCPQSGGPVTFPTRNTADAPRPTGFGGEDEPGVSVPPVSIVIASRGLCR